MTKLGPCSLSVALDISVLFGCIGRPRWAGFARCRGGQPSFLHDIIHRFPEDFPNSALPPLVVGLEKTICESGTQQGLGSTFADGGMLRAFLESSFWLNEAYAVESPVAAVPKGKKRCPRCNEIKDEGEFYGDRPACKKCLSEAARKTYQERKKGEFQKLPRNIRSS